MAQTTRLPQDRQTTNAESGERSGIFARVRLGRAFQPASREYVLIAATALLLTVFGLVMVLSATSATSTAAGGSPFDGLFRQGVFAAIGIPLMLLASRMPVSFWRRVAWPALILAVAFQCLVFTPLGIDDAGNQNWVRLGSFQAQPSEFLKLTLALWIGAVLFRKRTLLGLWRHVFIPFVPVSAAVIATVLAGHDLGTAMILVLIVLAGLFFSGVKLRIFVIPVILSIVAVGILTAMSSNRRDRIAALFTNDPLACYEGACWQRLHGIWGLASGGFFGLGLGNSKEKYGWLPAASNDYIFAVVGEELGLIGALLVLAMFGLFAVGAFSIVRRTDDGFVRIVAGAITVWIVGQALINIGVVLGLLPGLGVPLPFMSQGGTALLSVLIACGVLLSFARSLPPLTRDLAVRAPRHGSSAGRKTVA